MTEEEKKAIKVLEKYKFSEREEYLENNAKKIGKKYEDLYLERTWIPTTYERKQFTIVYNLIEKLQKENEEKDKKILGRKFYEVDLNELLKENYIPKGKIREKLEKIEKEKEQYYAAGQHLMYMLLKNQLKSLIEEE